jgi:hypothetical protein
MFCRGNVWSRDDSALSHVSLLRPKQYETKVRAKVWTWPPPPQHEPGVPTIPHRHRVQQSISNDDGIFWNDTPCSLVNTNASEEAAVMILCGLLYDPDSRYAITCRRQGSKMNDESEGMWKETAAAWSSHLPARLRKTTKNFNHDSQCPGWDSNAAHSEYNCRIIVVNGRI